MLFLRILSPACFLNQIPQKFYSLTTRSLSIILLAATMTSCGSEGTTNSTTSPDQESNDPQIVKTANKPAETDAISFTEDDIEDLKSKFVFEEGWYHHKHWGRKLLKRRTLTADVNESGYYTLNSNYFSPKETGHNGVHVTIGGKKIISEKVDVKSNNHRAEKDAKGVFELNSYSSYGDNGIFEQIGMSGEEAVDVRFLLKKGYVEEELSKADQQALKDCFRLSLILREIAKNKK